MRKQNNQIIVIFEIEEKFEASEKEVPAPDEELRATPMRARQHPMDGRREASAHVQVPTRASNTPGIKGEEE